ncbi:MAG: hypothetical protein ACHQKY_16960, partial [Terriglobia bacterium]
HVIKRILCLHVKANQVSGCLFGTWVRGLTFLGPGVIETHRRDVPTALLYQYRLDVFTRPKARA